MEKDEIISAFAFKTGKEIENLIKEQTGNLVERNRITESKILEWYRKTKDKEFVVHFGITTSREGIIHKN